MNRISVGIIGDGISAYRHAHAVNSDGRFLLSSLAPKSMKKGMELMRIHNIPHLDADPEYLLQRDDIDVVVLSLPTIVHSRYIEYAKRYDKALIIESPVTLSLSEGERILEEVRNEGAFFFNGNPYLYCEEIKGIDSSFHSFSVSFPSICLAPDEMLDIALETLVRAFGSVISFKAGKNDGVFSVTLERGEGVLTLLRESDSHGLYLIVDGRVVLSGAQYYRFLPLLYSYVFSRLEDGKPTDDTFFCTLEALRAVNLLTESERKTLQTL